MNKRQRELSKRDRCILGFIARYRAVTEDALTAHCFPAADSRKNVQRVLRRLVERDCLRKHAWNRSWAYYVLASQGYVAMNLVPRSTRAFTEQSLPVALAIMFYCLRHECQRLTLDEFRQQFPELFRPGLRSSQYVLRRTTAGIKLEMLIVDRGGAARRLRSRVRRAVFQRRSLSKFSSLIQAGRFRVNILTGTEEQLAKIQNHLARQSFGPVEVCATLVPELSDILV